MFIKFVFFTKVTIILRGDKNARPKNAGRSEMQARELRDWKMRHQTARMENAGLENT